MKALEFIKDIFQWRNGWQNEEHDQMMQDFINVVCDRVLCIPAGTAMTQVEMINPEDPTSTAILTVVKTATTTRSARITNIRYIDDSKLIFSINQLQKGSDYLYEETFYQVNLHTLLDCDNCYFKTNNFNSLTLSFGEISSSS